MKGITATPTIAGLIVQLFHARTNAHIQHLRTKSYATHVALNEFYDNIVNLADKFAEAYQGRHGLIGPINLMSAKKTSNVVEFLEDSLAEVEKMRYDVVAKTDTPLQNIIDEIVGQYLSTLYKLKFLA